MRKRFFWNPSGALQNWPSLGERGKIEPFNWVKIENRGANPVRFALSPLTADDAMQYYASIPNGKVRIFNVAGPHDDPSREGEGWPRELHLLSVTGGTTVMIEISDTDIADIDQSI